MSLQPGSITPPFLSHEMKRLEAESKNKVKAFFSRNVLLSATLRRMARRSLPTVSRPGEHTDQCKSSGVPDGAAEQDGVLQDDGESRAQGLQRQLGNIDVIDDDPP